MSTSRDRLRGRLETLERVLKPVGLGVLIVPAAVPRDEWDDWIEEHVLVGRPFIVIPEKESR